MSERKITMMVVEDDHSILNLITTTLKMNDYRYLATSSGKEAVMMAASHKPDIILLDLGLPDLDGIEVIRSIRSWSTMPIIVISARSEDDDKIDALDAGADDYLTKPFSVDELLARIRTTIRRLNYMMNESPEESVFINGDLKIDYQAGCAYFKDEPLHLTPNEYRLLCLLARNVGKVLTHSYLTKEIWGSSWDSDIASLRVYMTTLRKKLDADSEQPYIQTHIGIGYRMVRF